MKVYIWCDGAAMPNGGPAGAGYVVVGPALAILLRGRHGLRLVLLSSMFVLTAIPIRYYGITAWNQQYRGHVRGFEFSLIGMLAMALLVSCSLDGAGLVRPLVADQWADALDHVERDRATMVAAGLRRAAAFTARASGAALAAAYTTALEKS